MSEASNIEDIAKQMGVLREAIGMAFDVIEKQSKLQSESLKETVAALKELEEFRRVRQAE